MHSHVTLFKSVQLKFQVLMKPDLAESGSAWLYFKFPVVDSIDLTLMCFCPFRHGLFCLSLARFHKS